MIHEGGRARSAPDRVSAAHIGIDIEALYVSNWRSLVRLAYLLIGDAEVAEDLVQEAFIALDSSSTIRDSGAAIGYLRSTVTNLCRSHLRRRYTVRRFAHLLRDASSSIVDPIAIADEDRAVLDLVERLPARQREILVLRYWCDMSEADIATTLHISAGAVKASASRGIRALRTRLESAE
jgi:RNA polymerase sigma-70 factor (sigma-E family)